MVETERHDYDVVVIGAGGSGLRAAIAAHESGARTAIVCKSLLGKAHTVMAEGGAAAAMGNVWPEDNWQVHFRDTMRGGKMLNNWRMAQLHAMESPDRVLARLKGRFPMVLVEHDMTAVFALADRISVLIYGRILASGAPDKVRADPAVVAAYLGDEME